MTTNRGWLSSAVLAATLALGCAGPAGAQTPGFETRLAQVSASGPTVLLQDWGCWYGIDKNCAQANCHMTTTERPRHGTLTPSFHPIVIPPRGGICAGRPMNGLFVTYTPRPGYVGPDQVTLRSIADNGGRHILIYKIDVRP